MEISRGDDIKRSIMGVHTVWDNDMATKKTAKAAKKSAGTSSSSMKLDQSAIDKVRKGLDQGAVTPSIEDSTKEIVKLLNDSLATELVCVMRYKRHHFTAKGLESPAIAAEFMVHAEAEARHADRIAERIVQLQGEPDYNPATLLSRSHADYNEDLDLKSMIRSNLIAERIAVETYRQMAQLIGDRDPTTRRLIESILEDEEEHADELSDWMDRV